MSISCDIAKDLIPLCVDNIASEKSMLCVENHIKNCPECSIFYSDCKNDISDTPQSLPEQSYCTSNVKNSYLALSKKLQRRRILKIISACAIGAACLYCIIRDIYSIIKTKK